ncbi:discoidin domain-containing protein [Rhodoferax sp.]|uniref:discoidin domain-containing protein n=1 Tax=Rhodoferax sp. TaxID=50421 RepID=UPI00274E75C2|nr:discoidin domain-containing protein [Rhodoferax sp.]
MKLAWTTCRLRHGAVYAALTLAAQVLAQGSAGSALRTLDNFDELTPWTANASDQVKASLRQVQGVAGNALCLDYDFNGVAGYAYARRALPLVFPDNYSFEIQVRGDAPSNKLEVKWVDASGDNVWWAQRRDFTPPANWETWRIKKRHIEMAWGPSQDSTLRQTASMELVVSSGKGGGRGSLCFDELRWSELPAAPVTVPLPSLTVSSTEPAPVWQAVQDVLLGAAWRQVPLSVDGRTQTAWRSAEGNGKAQQLVLDFGQLREFGGMVLHWAPGEAASRYDVQVSDDRQHWTTLREVRAAAGQDHYLLLPESETRYLRLLLHDGPGARYHLRSLELREVAFGASPNAFFQALAKEAPLGAYPRGFSGQQPYWTLVGVDGGSDSGLLGEDGAIEVGKGGFSIEPFLITGPGASGRVSWAQVQSRQTLQDGYLPIPSVHWRHQDLALEMTAIGVGTPAQAQLLGRYHLTNLGATAQTFKLVLALRPFQVNPPMQFLNTPGGVHRIDSIAWDQHAVSVNGQRRVWPLQSPDAFVASSFEAEPVLDKVAQGGSKAAKSLVDDFGYASGALVYEVMLPPRGSRTIDLLMPLSGAPPDLAQIGRDLHWAQRQHAQVAAAWRAKLNQVVLQVPKAGQPVVDTLRSSLAHMLMSRDGAALQPGTRAYARSWIRDGAMMVEGLLRLGQTQVASDFVQWYAPYQFSSGKVPCCVDQRGADPVPENDSHGQLIFAVAELYRYTHDKQQLARLWPHVERAATYMETLRQSERSAQNLVGDARAFWGMMPASISHEGYSAKPMHSYWDNFWALRGYKDVAMLAGVLGHTALAQRFAVQRDEFQRELHQSLAVTAARHGIDYLSGAAELGDFDATSSTVALSPGGEQSRLDPKLLHGTFERYWQEFVARRDGKRPWDDYTPYELRTVGSFLRLGQPERAHALLKFFFSDQRPPGWNQWAEVVGRDARKPRFVGDMPHAWISSDYIRSALDLFAFEREADQALVLAAGIPLEWLQGRGVTVSGLHTSYGKLAYRLRLSRGQLRLDVQGGLAAPPGGFVLQWPGSSPLPPAFVNGVARPWSGKALKVAYTKDL